MRNSALVSGLLKDATVLVCCAMGKNVTRMSKKYCEVVSAGNNLNKEPGMVKERYEVLLEQIRRTLGVDIEIVRI